MLSSILDRGYDLSEVVASRVFNSSEEASAAIHLLSKAAVQLGKPTAVQQLGMASALGRSEVDPLDSVPEVVPVLVPVRALVIRLYM